MGTTTQDPELETMERMRAMLDGLKPEVSYRILTWLMDRYDAHKVTGGLYQSHGLEELRP